MPRAGRPRPRGALRRRGGRRRRPHRAALAGRVEGARARSRQGSRRGGAGGEVLRSCRPDGVAAPAELRRFAPLLQRSRALLMEARLDQQRVAAARMWAAMRYPYLASALFASSVVATPKLGSIAADRSWRLYMDPALVDSWRCDEIGSLLIHHVGHLLRDHAGRAERLGIDATSEADWVTAADAEINDDLVESGLAFPVEQIVPSAFECEPGGFAEDYFRAHPRKAGARASAEAARTRSPASGKRTRTTPSPRMARHPSRPPPSCCDARSPWRSAAGPDELPGSVPLGWQRWADELLEPRWTGARPSAPPSAPTWRTWRAASITPTAGPRGARASRATSSSRRFRGRCPNVAVVIDTSASMSEEVLGEVVAELDGHPPRGRRRPQPRACAGLRHGGPQAAAGERGPPGTALRRRWNGHGCGHRRGDGAAARAVGDRRLTDGYTPWPAEKPPRARVVVGLLGAGDRAGARLGGS